MNETPNPTPPHEITAHEITAHETSAQEIAPPSFLEVGDPARRIAYRRTPAAAGGARPGGLWLGGFRSDMLSTKAARLEAHAAAQGRAFLRFDYSGHGESGGRNEEKIDRIRSSTTKPDGKLKRPPERHRCYDHTPYAEATAKGPSNQ